MDYLHERTSQRCLSFLLGLFLFTGMALPAFAQPDPIDNLEVRMFIVTNSVLFTMVRHISQHNGLIRENDLATELTSMVANYMVLPPQSSEAQP